MHRAYSFYPLFPVPSDLSHEVNLDVSHMEGLRLCTEEMPDSAPDVLVVPSRLNTSQRSLDFFLTIIWTIALIQLSIKGGRQHCCCESLLATKGIVAKLWFGGQGNGPVRARIKVEVGKLSELVPLSIWHGVISSGSITHLCIFAHWLYPWFTEHLVVEAHFSGIQGPGARYLQVLRHSQEVRHKLQYTLAMVNHCTYN